MAPASCRALKFDVRWLYRNHSVNGPVTGKAERKDGVAVMERASRMEKLSGAKIENCEIIKAAVHDSGAFSLPGGGKLEGLPEVCAVSMVLRPSATSYIRVELWLPTETWNGRFLGTGNGGSAGGIVWQALADGVRKGYATANTDMGTSPDVDCSVGDPQRWADFGHRATHLMTTASKELLKRFYGRPAEYSYFSGQSTGGQQALCEAQRYPEDYDGIVAGVPANNRTLLHAYFLWNYQALHTAGGAALFTEEQIKNLTDAAVACFKSKKGEFPQDTFITDPRGDEQTAEEIIRLARKNGAALTEKQCSALRRLYAGPTNPRTGERIYTPVPFGSEFSSPGILMQQRLKGMKGLLYVFRWVFGKDYDYMKFDFDRDMETYQEALSEHVNANCSDLHAYKNHGGKLILYSGSADPLVPYQDALSYYERVIENQKGLAPAMEFIRYFIIPGMSHGNDGPGAQYAACRIDGIQKEPLDAVVAWREQGKAPDMLLAVRKNGDEKDFCRPVYPYPQKAVCSSADPSRCFSETGERDGVEKIARRYLQDQACTD